MHKARFIVVLYVLPLAALCYAAPPEPGPARTVIKLKGKEPEMVDEVVYRPASREFRVTKGAATITYAASQMEYCKPPKPSGFDTASQPALEATVKTYERRWWDVEAFKRLMPLYLTAGLTGPAIKLYHDMEPNLGDSMPLDMRVAFWNALLKDGQKTTLDKLLNVAATTGSRELQAAAYITRGDMLKAGGSPDLALIEGYLKALVLFEDLKRVRREALEKTIAAMEAMGDTRADKFRKTLIEEFPR